MNRHFVFILGSGRRDGNSELLARRAAEFLPAGARQTWLHLLDFPLEAFEDLRHPTSRYGPPDGAEKALLEATLAATDLVFVTPLYWYSVSAATKNYLDHWSKWLRVADFKKGMAGKKIWAVTTHSSGGEIRKMAAPLVGCLRLSADYMAMVWQGILFGEANLPDQVLGDEKAMKKARRFFR